MDVHDITINDEAETFYFKQPSGVNNALLFAQINVLKCLK